MNDSAFGQAHAIDPRAQQKALLDLAFSRSDSIYYIARCDEGFPLSFISENVERITGHEAVDFLKVESFREELLHPEDRDVFMGVAAMLRQRGEVTLDYRLATSQGGYLWIRDDLNC